MTPIVYGSGAGDAIDADKAKTRRPPRMRPTDARTFIVLRGRAGEFALQLGVPRGRLDHVLAYFEPALVDVHLFVRQHGERKLGIDHHAPEVGAAVFDRVRDP